MSAVAERDDGLVEHFEWKSLRWDVGRIRRDLESGSLSAEEYTWGADFVRGYATGLLGMPSGDREVAELRSDPGAPKRRFSLVHVSVGHALGLPEESLDKPLIVVATAERDGGVIRVADGAPRCHIVGDGNHRIARAYLLGLGGRSGLRAKVLSQVQSNGYLR